VNARIRLDWIHKLVDWIGWCLEKWTHVQLCAINTKRTELLHVKSQKTSSEGIAIRMLTPGERQSKSLFSRKAHDEKVKQYERSYNRKPHF